MISVVSHRTRQPIIHSHRSGHIYAALEQLLGTLNTLPRPGNREHMKETYASNKNTYLNLGGKPFFQRKEKLYKYHHALCSGSLLASTNIEPVCSTNWHLAYAVFCDQTNYSLIPVLVLLGFSFLIFGHLVIPNLCYNIRRGGGVHL